MGVACSQPAPSPAGSGEPSPNASIKPAPLSSGAELIPQKPTRRLPDGGRVGIPADSAGRLLLRDAGRPAPTPLRAMDTLALDTRQARENGGVSLDAEWVWTQLPSPPARNEVNKENIEILREKLALRVDIDILEVGRMRVGLAAPGFPLPQGTELRAREDRYGHVVVWAHKRAYRIVPPGALRAIFAERRADVAPVMRGTLQKLGTGTVLGMSTERVRVTSELGLVELDQAKVAGAGLGGQLLCRFLVELVGTDPATDACTPELTPVHAKLRWGKAPGKGGVELEVKSVTRHPELSAGRALVPPAGASVQRGELPQPATGVLVSQNDLTSLRREIPEGLEPDTQNPPGEGLLAENHTHTLRYVLLDGVPVAWVKPRDKQYLIGPQKGRYSVQWRDFLGESISKPRELNLPARIAMGEKADGGAPKE